MTPARPALAGLLLGLAMAATACATTQSAAASDPMRCERDPSCVHHADKAKDCVTQCVDDPACIDRCREVTGQFR
jgi:hypothetical protein